MYYAIAIINCYSFIIMHMTITFLYTIYNYYTYV